MVAWAYPRTRCVGDAVVYQQLMTMAHGSGRIVKKLFTSSDPLCEEHLCTYRKFASSETKEICSLVIPHAADSPAKDQER